MNDVRGDEKGKWTYTGRKGDSVIDYVTGNVRVKERIDRLTVEEKIRFGPPPDISLDKGQG